MAPAHNAVRELFYWVRYMDIKLYYTEKGSGEPLILLHGNGEDSGYFKEQIRFFSKHFRVIAVDTRGHGRSQRGTAPFTLSQFADDLKCFMDSMGIKKAHILGFSDGANIAMIFALRYPSMTDRLILNSGNLFPSGMKLRVRLPIEAGYRLYSALSKVSISAKRQAELLGLMTNEPDIRPSELAAIKAKTLVIAGNKDMIKESHTRLIAGSLPNSQLAIICGDHFAAAKNPRVFDRVVYGFLTEKD